MLLNVHCISLRVVKHSDTTSIITVWSMERGRMAFAVPSGAGREAQRRRAMMMPMSVFEGVANIRKGSDIARISDVRAYRGGNASALDPIKNITAQFLADFLDAVLRESQPDPLLTEYLFQAVETMKEADKASIANFHLYFTYRLGQFLGIAPDIGTYHRNSYFDMREGVFTMTMPLHKSYIEPARAKMVYILARLNAYNLKYLRLSHAERNQILDHILEYYSLHHTQVTNLQSLQVIRTLFT